MSGLLGDPIEHPSMQAGTVLVGRIANCYLCRPKMHLRVCTMSASYQTMELLYGVQERIYS